MAAAFGWHCLAKAWCKVFIYIRLIHVDSLRVSRLSSFMESRLQPGTPLRHKTTSIPFRTLSQALKNQQINNLMHRSSTRMHSMVLTLDTILQAEFCTNPRLRTIFGDHAGVQVNSCSMLPYRHLVSTWSSSADMAGSIRINVLQLLHHSADAPPPRKGIGAADCTVSLGQRLHWYILHVAGFCEVSRENFDSCLILDTPTVQYNCDTISILYISVSVHHEVAEPFLWAIGMRSHCEHVELHGPATAIFYH